VVRVACAAVSWDGASWTQLSHPSTLARERASNPPRMQPSCAVFHPADTRHRALAGRRDGAHHSRRKIH
jgi:hypothetical protein